MRLKGFDYAQPGAYFATICTRNRECLFGLIANDKMVLNELGRIVESEWMKTSEVWADATLDAFVVMPNHLNGLIMTDRTTAGGLSVAATRTSRPYVPPYRPGAGTLGAIIGQFKPLATKRINAVCGTPGAPCLAA